VTHCDPIELTHDALTIACSRPVPVVHGGLVGVLIATEFVVIGLSYRAVTCEKLYGDGNYEWETAAGKPAVIIRIN